MRDYDFQTLRSRMNGAAVRVVAQRSTRRQRNLAETVLSTAMESAVFVSETTIATANGTYERFCVGVHGFGPNERWLMT